MLMFYRSLSQQLHCALGTWNPNNGTQIIFDSQWSTSSKHIISTDWNCNSASPRFPILACRFLERKLKKPHCRLQRMFLWTQAWRLRLCSWAFTTPLVAKQGLCILTTLYLMDTQRLDINLRCGKPTSPASCWSMWTFLKQKKFLTSRQPLFSFTCNSELVTHIVYLKTVNLTQQKVGKQRRQ